MLKPDVSKEKGGKVVVQSLLCKKYLYLILLSCYFVEVKHENT